MVGNLSEALRSPRNSLDLEVVPLYTGCKLTGQLGKRLGQHLEVGI